MNKVYKALKPYLKSCYHCAIDCDLYFFLHTFPIIFISEESCFSNRGKHVALVWASVLIKLYKWMNAICQYRLEWNRRHQHLCYEMLPQKALLKSMGYVLFIREPWAVTRWVLLSRWGKGKVLWHLMGWGMVGESTAFQDGSQCQVDHLTSHLLCAKYLIFLIITFIFLQI